MEKQMIDTPHGNIAVYTGGVPPSPSVPTLLLIHGNSCSSLIFRPIFASPEFSQQLNLLAFDLPGHGLSSDAPDPEKTYHQPGYAETAAYILRALKISSVIVLGWSLGGHTAIELVPLLKGQPGSSPPCRLLGYMIVGSPPSLGPEQTGRGFKSGPGHINLAAQEKLTEEEIELFAHGTATAPYEDWMKDNVARTDGRARLIMFKAFATGSKGIDQVGLVRDEKDALCAVVNGGDEPFVNLDYLDELEYGNLWGGKCIRLEGLHHAPFWEKPEVFGPVLEKFVEDCKKKL